MKKSQLSKEEIIDTLEYFENNEEAKMWDAISKMRWATISAEFYTKASDVIEEYLVRNYVAKDIVKLHNFVVDKRKYLMNTLEDFLDETEIDEYDVSDDTLWDLCSHIVGMGEEMFYFVIDNPSVIDKIIPTVVENFEYGFNSAIFRLNMEEDDVEGIDDTASTENVCDDYCHAYSYDLTCDDDEYDEETDEPLYEEEETIEDVDEKDIEEVEKTPMEKYKELAYKVLDEMNQYFGKKTEHDLDETKIEYFDNGYSVTKTRKTKF